MFDEIIEKLFRRKQNSGEAAKKRLKFALIYDKLEVSEDILKDLQRDIIDVISRYFEIEQDALKLNISKTGEMSALVFNTPILSAKRPVASNKT